MSIESRIKALESWINTYTKLWCYDDLEYKRELKQECRLKMVECLTKDPTLPDKYLLQAIKNRLFDINRARKAQYELQADADWEEYFVAACDVAGTTQVWDEVIYSLKHLPKKWRRVILAKAYFDHDGEAATFLGMPMGTYRSTLARARKRIRQITEAAA